MKSIDNYVNLWYNKMQTNAKILEPFDFGNQKRKEDFSYYKKLDVT